MKKYGINLGVLLVAATACNITLAQTNYPLKCRGPLEYVVGTGQKTTVVFFAKNATRAGESGKSLQPGTCAWNDRPVAASEPGKIFIKPETSTKVQPAFTAFTACAGNASCVVEFLAHNANSSSNPNFRVEDSYIRVYYPNF